MGTEAVKTGEEKWWDWVSPSHESLPDDASSHAKKQYFDELVKRCVLVESLSPLVTSQILLAAIDQFATVLGIKLLRPPHVEAKPTSAGVLPNYSGMAVVEMEKPQRAEVVVTQLREYMLMVGGMPRPARAQMAKALMLVDHPCNRKRVPANVKLVSYTDKSAPALLAKKRKAGEHMKAATYLRELQEREEDELHSKQERSYKDLKEKYQRIKDNQDLKELRIKYNMPIRR
ncbi:hypothetical protein M758_3G159900 [Ceratodon purpureus]|uniref:Uncharacterized protein n=1 Tax=Ceratodon purpureus TaxID=3225 RepID=A0A8T0IKG7_CERPU|nr:hypothetical protein KC19_3G160500 [Ceratodon purpureus]KAG0623255.1 hypothetical protein M758_3G159900 [Ceratodon purpureus]